MPVFGAVTLPPPLKPAIDGNATWPTPDRTSLACESTVKLPGPVGL